eukprot:jgi/Orpsp1_1/1192561/evm.model.d7180000094213.1
MDNKEYSDLKVITNNNEYLINNKEKYSNVMNEKQITNSIIMHHNRNIQQLQHELLNSKNNNISMTLNDNDKEIIQNKINIQTEENINKVELSNMNIEGENNNTSNKINQEKITVKNKKFNGPTIEIKNNKENNKEKKHDPLLFSQGEKLISPIEKIKVIDSFINMNSLPSPTTSAHLSDSSSTSSSPTLLPISTTISPSEINTNKDNTNNELSSSIQRKIQSELIKIFM